MKRGKLRDSGGFRHHNGKLVPVWETGYKPGDLLQRTDRYDQWVFPEPDIAPMTGAYTQNIASGSIVVVLSVLRVGLTDYLLLLHGGCHIGWMHPAGYVKIMVHPC